MNLFHDIDLRQSLDTIANKLQEKVDNYTDQEILANDFELLVENLYEEFYSAS